MSFRTPISLLLVLTLSVVFVFSAFASPVLEERAAGSGHDLLVVEGPAALQGPSGSLSGTGEIKINGNRATTGATVLSGNEIETGIDGDASIEMAQLGRVQLRPDAEIKLNMTQGRFEVIVEECSSITLTVPSGVVGEAKMEGSQLAEVAVTTGEVRVNPRSGGETILRAGESKTFNEGIQSVVANGEAVFTMNCCECDIPGAIFFFPGWWLWGTLGAIAAAIPVAIEIGDEDKPVSGVRP